MAKRYGYLFDLVRELNPKHAVEIGTWNGRNAVEWMALTNCYYTGFDLFEEATKELNEAELNVKPSFEVVETGNNIERMGFDKFCLIRGNTRETLWNFDIDPFDFCFIDGGHSEETIKNDFEWAKENITPGGVIILDDYYTPEIKGFGCNFVEGDVVGPEDKTAMGGTVQLLRVDC